MCRSIAVAALSIVMGFLAAGAVSAVPILTPIAVSGDPAPGTSSPLSYTNVFGPTLNESNDVVFHAALSDFSEALYFSSGPTPQLIAHRGQQAAGLPAGVVYNSPGGVLLNDAREVVFYASLQGRAAGVVAGNNEAIFAGAPGGIRPVAREGDPAPSTGGAFYGSLAAPTTFNDVGEFAFNAVLTGPGVDSTNNRALYVGTPDSLYLAVRIGSPAPEAGVGVVFREINNAYLNDSGELIVQGMLSGAGVTFGNNDVLYGGTADDLRIIGRAGQQAPDLPAGVEFRDFAPGTTRQVVTDSGMLAFVAHLQGTGVTPSSDRAIFAGPRGALEVVAREGEPVPGMPGYEYLLVRGIIRANDADQLLFAAAVRNGGVTKELLFLRTPTSVQPVPSSLDQAPGLAVGVEIPTMAPVVMNDAGQMIFVADLIGPGISSINDRALYFYEPSTDAYTLLLQDGTEFDMGLGDVRLLGSARFMTSLGDDGFWRTLSNSGDLTLRYTTFDPGGTVILGPERLLGPDPDPDPIPEPSTGLLLLAGCALIWTALRRRSHRS